MVYFFEKYLTASALIRWNGLSNSVPEYFWIFLSIIIRERLNLEVWCLRQCCWISRDASNAVRTISIPLSVQKSIAVYSWKGVFRRNFSKSRWIGKIDKNSIIPIDSGGRETYFGPINLGQNSLKIFWKFLRDLVFFRIFKNFFITVSRSTDHNPLIHWNFFLSTSIPETTCLDGYISRTVGLRGSVSEGMLLHFGVECC